MTSRGVAGRSGHCGILAERVDGMTSRGVGIPAERVDVMTSRGVAALVPPKAWHLDTPARDQLPLNFSQQAI